MRLRSKSVDHRPVRVVEAVGLGRAVQQDIAD